MVCNRTIGLARASGAGSGRALWSAVALTALLAAAAACSGHPTAPTPTPSLPPTADQPPTPPAPPTPPTPNTPPALTVSCPSNISSSTSSLGTPVAVTFNAPTASGGVPPLQVTCTRETGSLFEVGATTVQCTATDTAGQSSPCTFNVTVTAATPRLSRTKFLAFGDSLTSGEVAEATFSRESPVGGPPSFALKIIPSASYPSQLANLLRARYREQTSAIEVVNSGWPAELASEALDRFTAVVSILRPQVVIVFHGYNDIAADGEAGIVRGARGIDAMAKEARFRGARVILATLPPPRPGGKNSNDPALVAGMNAWIRTIATGEGAILVDLYGALVTDLTRYIGADGLHPTEAGYQKIAEVLFDAIKNDLEIR